MASELSIISVKNNLRQDVRSFQVKKQIIERIIELGLNNSKYKLDNEVLELVCNSIEFLITKKDHISKKDLCIEIFQSVFNLEEGDVEAISRNIEYLFNNKRIRKVSYYKIFRTGIQEWIKKRVL